MVKPYIPQLKNLPDKAETSFIQRVDARTPLRRRLQVAYNELLAEAGGPQSVPYAKLALIERFCWLEEFLREIELEMTTSPKRRDELIGRWVQGCNSITGLARMLGYQDKTPTGWIDALYAEPKQAEKMPVKASSSPDSDDEEDATTRKIKLRSKLSKSKVRKPDEDV